MNQYILPPRPIQPIVIEYVAGDEITHRPPFFYCRFPDCPCHSDHELADALQQAVTRGEITPAAALEIFWNLEGEHQS